MVKQQFLVFRPGALGDTILTIDALLALKRRFPEADIELIGNAEAGAVLAAADVVAHVTSFDSAEVMGLYTSPATVPPRWAAAAGAVIWLVRGDPVAAALIKAGLDPVVVAHPPLAGGTVHAADHLIATLAPLGVTPLSSTSRLTLPPGEGAPPPRFPPRLVLVHPGSGSAAKNWPATRFAALARILMEEGWPLALLSGPADAESLAGVVAKLGPEAPLVVTPASVMDLARTLASVAIFIGNDSGVSHLSARIGVPTVAIFGPTDPRQWAPRGPSVTVVAGAAWPEVGEVHEAVAQLLQQR